MIRQFTTHSSLLLLLVGLVGCTHAPSKPSLDSSRNPELLTPDLYPSGATSEREVRYGRYTLVNTAPGIEQRDLMTQIIDINIPANLRPTVRDAMQYVLNRSGYSLCGPEASHVNILFTRPLPAAQYKLGPMSLRNTLQVLAGPAWQVKVDEVMRNVCFVLRPGYQLPDPPRSALATLPPATAPATSPAPTPAKSTPSTVVTTAVPSAKPLVASTTTAGASGGQIPAASVSQATVGKPAPALAPVSATTPTPASTAPTAPAAEAAKTTSAAAPLRESPQESRPATSVARHSSSPLIWQVSPTQGTMRETLSGWAQKSGWTFKPEHWAVSVDIPLTAAATFQGEFESAVQQLISTTELTETPLQPCFYTNRVVRVVPYNEACDRMSPR